MQKRRRSRVVRIKERCFKDCTLLDKYMDADTLQKFWLSKALIMELYTQLREYLEPSTQKSHAMKKKHLGKASYQMVPGKLVGISHASSPMYCMFSVQ